jgi:membrane protease subunit HflK
MERNIQKNGLVNLVILLLTSVASLTVARYTHSLAGEVVCMFLGLGVLIAGVSWFQMRLEEQERLERMEYEELARGADSGRLFQTQAGDSLPARRSREMFEKYFIRVFTVVLFFLQAGGAWLFWRWLESRPAGPMNQPLMAMALLGMFALILFLMGKYAAGLAQLENQRLLRPGASFLLLGAYLEALVVAGLIAVEADFPKVDFYLARGLSLVLGLLAVETFLGLLLDIYRPRIPGQVGLLLYESRLVGLLSRPEGLFVTAAHALDYQFGFKVSETWFYQFLQRALAWILLAQVAILFASTCLVFVEVGEEALLERFGKPRAGRDVLQPGLHWKLPWPIDQVHRFRTREIQSFNVGFKHDESEEEAKTLLWTVEHYREEYHLLVASREQLAETNNPAGRKSPPVNLVSLNIPVKYQISDVRAWAYQHDDAGALLERVATREVVRYLVGADMSDLLSVSRFEAGDELRRRIQSRADELKLGVKILFAGLQNIHPPVRVAKSYEKVVAARQNREANILSAKAHQILTNALAHADSLRIQRAAEAEQRRLAVSALAREALFTNQVPAYSAAPSVYAQRAYLETLAKGSAETRKIILATTNTQDVILLNLEEKIRADILDVPLPAPAIRTNRNP